MHRFVWLVLALAVVRAPTAFAQASTIEDCEGVEHPFCEQAPGGAQSMAAETDMSGIFQLYDRAAGDVKHRYAGPSTSWYCEQWQLRNNANGWASILSDCDAPMVDDLFDHFSHAHGNDVMFGSDTDGPPYIGGGFASPRIKVGKSTHDGDTVPTAPPLVDAFGAPCIRYGIAGCDLPLPPETHGPPVEIDTWQLVSSPFGDARGWVSWLLFDTAGNHVATIELTDKTQLANLVPVYRDILERSGRPVYLNQHDHYLVSNRIPRGLRFSDSPWEGFETGPCNWSVDYHCSPAIYMDQGEYHWFVPHRWQKIILFPPFTDPFGPIAFIASYEQGDPIAEVVQDVELRRAYQYLRSVRAVGNHPGVQQNAGAGVSGVWGTNVTGLGTSEAVSDPRDLRHFNRCQRFDGDGDGVIGTFDFGLWKQEWNAECVGYFP